MNNSLPVYIDVPLLGDGVIQCSVCGHADEIDGYDVMGADEDCLFCLQCSAELRPADYVPPVQRRERIKP